MSPFWTDMTASMDYYILVAETNQVHLCLSCQPKNHLVTQATVNLKYVF